MKHATDVLAASAAFLERCMDDERAEIIERLCASAAPAPPSRQWLSTRETVEGAAVRRERATRIDLFATDYDIFGEPVGWDDDTSRDVRLGNVAMFPDLYGEWVYRPC